MKKRSIHGILLLDKPEGITSNAALQRVKWLFSALKAGHTGSLDPLATGMLPLCFGEATKLSSYLLDSDKSYLATARLGAVTDSADSDGQIVKQRAIPSDLNAALMEQVLDRFRGPIEQIPPMYSALKHQGKRLHELARAGKTVERKARHVTINGLQLEALQGDSFRIAVSCSKGTYIRTLVEDIGEALGCGAHITALRRTGVIPFYDLPMTTIPQVEELSEAAPADLMQRLLPCDRALPQLPRVTLDAVEMAKFAHGNPARAATERLSAGDPLFSAQTAWDAAQNQMATTLPGGPAPFAARVYTESGRFSGLGEVARIGVSPDSADYLQVRPKKVLNL